MLVTTGAAAILHSAAFHAFATPLEHHWYEPGCAQCYLPRTLAYDMMYGGPSTSIADESAREIYNPKLSD